MKLPETHFSVPHGCPIAGCGSKSYKHVRETKFDGYSFIEYMCVDCEATWFKQELVTGWGTTVAVVQQD